MPIYNKCLKFEFTLCRVKNYFLIYLDYLTDWITKDTKIPGE